VATYTELRNAVADKLYAVPGVGRTHNRLRYAADWKTFLDLLASNVTGNRQVRGWWVERERREDEYHSFGTMNQTHIFIVRGILGFSDAADTDSTFGDVVDAVMDQLGGTTITGAWHVAAPTLRVTDLRQFGSVLCHYCEIELPVMQEVAL
jgi:hypothetical protein